MYRLGIDVGGTNTDAVIINDNNLEIIKSVKVPTSRDVYDGIYKAIDEIFKGLYIDKTKIKKAMLGTTKCTNAIVEKKELNKVAVIRLAKPATMAIFPMIDWSDFNKFVEKVDILKGGFEYDGQILNEIDENEIRNFLNEVKGKVESVAITGVFSSIRKEQELRAREIVKEILGNDMHTSLSSELGSLNLIERENACILNSMLYSVANKFTDSFENALKEAGIKNADIYFSQNDGTLMNKDMVKNYPILTVACGPTNSIRGASYLSKLKNALIIDVGGTTTDVGVIVNEFPRESQIAVTIGGVRTNFRMPDIISIGLGGGSIVKEVDGKIKVGPESVGYNIIKESVCFGGNIITATDIAVKMGLCDLGDKSNLDKIDEEFAKKALDEIKRMFEDVIDAMKTENENVDVILVGGGSVICPNELNGTKKVYKPKFSQVANAIGSCISKISGNVEKLISYNNISRDEAIEIAKKEAIKNAINQGADENTIEVVNIEDYPLQYQTNNTYKIKIKVVGDIK